MPKIMHRHPSIGLWGLGMGHTSSNLDGGAEVGKRIDYTIAMEREGLSIVGE